MADSSERGNTRVVLIVALVGLLSTVAASALSAFAAVLVANTSFWNERTASVQDKRREVYADFLHSAVSICVSVATGDQNKMNQAYDELLNEEARVALVGGSDVADAAHEIIKEIGRIDGESHYCDNPTTLLPYREKFVEVAQTDIKRPD